MIINGDICPKCGENPQEDSTKDIHFSTDDEVKLLFDDGNGISVVVDAVIKCPCCDSEDLTTSNIWNEKKGANDKSPLCKVCGYNFADEVTAYKPEHSCGTCGDYFDKQNMKQLSGMGHCFPCITQFNDLPKHHMKVEFDKLDRMRIRLTCASCRLTKESRHIRSVNKSKDGWECYACSGVRYAGLMKKDDSPSKTTPKEVKQ